MMTLTRGRILDIQIRRQDGPNIKQARVTASASGVPTGHKDAGFFIHCPQQR